MKLNGGGIIPPPGFQGSLVATKPKIDVCPFMDAAVGQRRGNKIYIYSRCTGQARGVPGDVEGVTARHSHARRGVSVEAASCTRCGADQ